jgi:hypothetical protein
MTDPNATSPRKIITSVIERFTPRKPWAKAPAAGHQEQPLDRGIEQNGQQSRIGGRFHALAKRLDPPFGPAKPGIR